jgi:uncharacterized protein (DUF885 family)
MDLPVHRLCDSYVDDMVALDPTLATKLGLPGRDDALPELSPDWHAERERVAADALRAVAATEPTDESERDAKAVFTERLGIQRELDETGLPAAELNVIVSAPQDLRMVFDLMPTETADHWAIVAKRMAAVPAALAGYRASLAMSAGKGIVSAARQVTRVAAQCDGWAGRDGTSFFAEFAAGGPAELRGELDAAARAANQAYADLADFLRTELLAQAPVDDAVGAPAYELWSRLYLGARVDQREAYEWGWAEFARIESEMRAVADRIRPGATVAEAGAVLDTDPRYRIQGRDEFRSWMQRLSDQALSDLRDVHFEIPDAIMRLDCRIAPPGGGVGAYYTHPSDDFSRPGTMWWGLEPDKTEFTTWREVSTVYHEGVPGHHLQIAGAAYQSERLNRFQRVMCWVPGHSEGWALYAERLMDEFGYLSDDGDLLGMLNESLFRAARVIIDIGMHLKLEIPKGTGFHEGERWTPDLGLEFMLTRTITDEALVRDEIDRYLGWPGQAPTYKLGERLWLSAREDARRRQGASFDLKHFHTQALAMGQMGLDTLRERLAAL